MHAKEKKDFQGNVSRYITLSDGTGMNDELIVIKTTAPAELLKNLEQQSCEVYLQGKEDEVPMWSAVLTDAGYLFEVVASCEHVNASGTSNEWLTEWIESHEFCKEIDEHYIIENQPS